jgi:hypothetical protein
MATYAILSFTMEESSLSIILFALIMYADQVGGMEATRKSMYATSSNDMHVARPEGSHRDVQGRRIRTGPTSSRRIADQRPVLLRKN